MPSDHFYPALGPFQAELEIRTVGPDNLAYAFPKLVPASTALSDAFMDAPALSNALSKLEAHRRGAAPGPLVSVTTMVARPLVTLFPGMQLAPVAVVYRLPKEWAAVAGQVASQDISELFGMANLDGQHFRIRAGRHIWMPGEGLPTKLFMDLQEHTDIVSQCCDGERGFIGQFIPQIVACEDTVTIGGFFYDRAGLDEHLAGVEHMKQDPLDESRQQRGMRQAALVGTEPWRHRSWPVLNEGDSAYLVQATLV